MTDNKKVEISKENMEEVTGGYGGGGDMRRGPGGGGGSFEYSPCGPGITGSLYEYYYYSTLNSSKVPADKADGSRVDSVDKSNGNSYNNVNNGGKQMFVQQGKNTNTNTGKNQM